METTFKEDMDAEKVERKPANDDYLEDQIETLASHIVGGKDLNGYSIIKVYARGDEYVIYEIEESSEIDAFRVVIYTKEEDNLVPIRNFQSVKDSFDKLKSIFFRSGSDPSYKQRAASAIVTAIHGNVEESRALLESIEADAIEDYKHKIYGRLVYLLGAFVITGLCVLIGLLSYLFRDTSFLLSNPDLAKTLYAVSFAVLGGFLSVSLKAREVFTQRAIAYWMYAVYGAERLIASIIAGVATYIFISSGLILSSFGGDKNAIYILMVIAFISGFSEKFIPNSLSKIEQKSSEETNNSSNRTQ